MLVEQRLFNLKKDFLKPAFLKFVSIFPEAYAGNISDATLSGYRGVVRFVYLAAGVLSFEPAFRSKRWHRRRSIHRVMPYSLVGVGGLEATYDEAERLNREGIEGDFVELGVARGGCAALIVGLALQDGRTRQTWLFDSFEGLPEPGEKDFSSPGVTGDHVRPLPKGSCLGTIDEVRRLLFEKLGFPERKVHFVKGWFEKTVPVSRSKIAKIALLRIDGDWYDSTKVCLENLYDLVVERGVVIVDDYYSCVGCKKAVDEFILSREIKVELISDYRGGVFFRKIAVF